MGRRLPSAKNCCLLHFPVLAIRVSVQCKKNWIPHVQTNSKQLFWEPTSGILSLMYCKTYSHNWKTWVSFKLCHLKLIYHTSHLHVQLTMRKRHCVCSKVHNTESLSTHISWAWQGGQELDKNWFFWLMMICGNEEQFSVGNFFLHSINWRSWVMPTKLCSCLQLLHHHIQSMLTPSQDQPHRLIVSQSVSQYLFFFSFLQICFQKLSFQMQFQHFKMHSWQLNMNWKSDWVFVWLLIRLCGHIDNTSKIFLNFHANDKGQERTAESFWNVKENWLDILPGHMVEEHSRRQNDVTETFSISQNCLILCLRCWSLSPHVPKRQFPRGFGLWFLIPDHMDDKAGYEHLYWVFPMQVGSKLITN